MFSAERYLEQYLGVLSRLEAGTIDELAEVLTQTWRAKRMVFACGNGGSAANASHFVTDLTKLTAPARGHRVRALALTESAAAISAISNDIGYDDVFVEQLRSFIAPRDVLVAFSTSGTSPNVLRAVEYANRMGAITVAVTGQNGTRLRSLAQHAVVVHSTSVQQIEDATMTIGHLLCLRTRDLIAGESLDVTLQDAATALRVLRAQDEQAM